MKDLKELLSGALRGEELLGGDPRLKRLRQRCVDRPRV
jgi:hypothetical protein